MIFKYLLAVMLVSTLARSTIPPSSNFTLANFTGSWDVAAFFATEKLDLDFYSCATVNVTTTPLRQVTMSYNFIKLYIYAWTSFSLKYVSDPLTPAILTATASPILTNTMVVTYYDAGKGQAILINEDLTFGVVLVRSESSENDELESLSKQVFANLNVSKQGNLTFIYNKNCDLNGTSPVSDFHFETLRDKNFYGNAVFTAIPEFKNIVCLKPAVDLHNVYVNVTMTFEYEQMVKVVNDVFLPDPDTQSIFIDTLNKRESPYVFIYANSTTMTFAAAISDRSAGFVFSTQTTVPADEMENIKKAFDSNGLKISNETFYELTHHECGESRMKLTNFLAF